MQGEYYQFIIDSELTDVNLSGVRHYKYRYKLYHYNDKRHQPYSLNRLLFMGQWNYSLAAVKNFIDAVKKYGHNPDYIIVKKKNLGLEILLLSPNGIVIGWNTTLTDSYLDKIIPLDKTLLQEATIHEQ